MLRDVTVGDSRPTIQGRVLGCILGEGRVIPYILNSYTVVF